MYCKNKFSCILYVIILYISDKSFAATLSSSDPWLDCAPINDLPNGIHKVLEENYATGSPVPNYTLMKFECNDGYILSTSYDVIICIDGNWSERVPECVPKVEERLEDEDVECYWNFNERFPWHVGIYHKTEEKYQYICGGTIISRNVIITAAHCVENIKASNIYIAAGKLFSEYNSSREWDQQHRQVKEYVFPDNYNGLKSYLYGDIAVMTLVTPLIFNYGIRPACVDWENKFENEQLTPLNIGHVQGWGFTDIITKTPSEMLIQLDVPFVDTNDCLNTVPSNIRPHITKDKFCAGYTNGSSVCNGDDGGGLFFRKHDGNYNRYYIKGLVSSYPQINGVCDSYQYAIYTKISFYIDLIKEIVQRSKI